MTVDARFDDGGKRLNVDQLRRKITQLAKVIDAPSDNLPTYGSSRDFGHPHLEADAHLYHWIVRERGGERQRRSTASLDELLYIVFCATTFSMACDYEVRHRVAGQDFRRMLFAKQLELLGALSASWPAKKRSELEKVLLAHPFRDDKLNTLGPY